MAVKHRLWLTGARVLAVVAATTAAVRQNHRLDIRPEPSSDESKDLIPVEKWRNATEHGFIPARVSRQHSFAASTRSTCSIITYMRARGIFTFFDGRADTSFQGEYAIVDSENDESEGESEMGDASLNSPYVASAADIHPYLNGNVQNVTNRHSVHWEIAAVDLPEQHQSTINGQPERQSNHSFQHHQVGLPSALHHQSVTLFTALAPLISTCPQLQNSSHILLEDLGRLYLWGHDFDDGRLDALLATSNELKSTILELTATISKILTTVISPILLVSSSDATLLAQVMVVTEMLQHTQSYGYEDNQQDEAYGSESEDSDDEYDVDDAALVIRSSVDCLMGLLPSMERSLLSMKAGGTPESFET